MFANGTGVPKDRVTAFMWLGLASAQGNTGARQALASLIPIMTQDEIAEGQKRQIEAKRAAKK
jgi:TPR repeat protein